MIESCEFAESKQASQDNGSYKPQPMTDSDGFMDIPDGIEEELPFT